MEFSFNLSPIDGLYTVLLCILIGIEVIRNVPAILHTPLMSGSNAISGIIIIGGILQLMQYDPAFDARTIISSIGVLIGTINVSGGFFVTHRMLKMFKPKKIK
ncbi:NAD(P) transhydrogenase subunit alpha [Lishizhenia tianjinensis]|uniref:proton-translocating NAD(P)(+) transhydrogenase n=1 Tax=Lishizhenia tianjinensis TaxID=477690 RepID=A0A1I6YCY9_9FLAO|nr:NAD(P) transhydrogenase subunit alpha [Lishizhenia tianjinensis]SFT48268.1 NAD(P) transhydrogenase subunit alpha [Lishizhenia tianjinensis]